MASLTVVHGTGVRRSSYDSTLAIVKRKVHLARPDLKVVECYWGDVGGNLPEKPKCIPQESDRGGGPTASDISIEAWAALYDNPFLELEQVRASGMGRGLSEIQELAVHIQEVEPGAVLKSSLAALDAEAKWHAARQEVTIHPAFIVAINNAGDDSTPVRAIIARAIVAQITKQSLSRSLPVPNDEARNEWVELTCELLSPPSESISSLGTRGVAEIKEKLLGAAFYGIQWAAAGSAERKRMTEAATIAPVVGDIIFYQSPRGKVIREEIVKALSNAEKPRYVLAHSLGSVAAVDTLVFHKDLEVERLFTIGSPAPAFYELNALLSLSREERLPEHFPKWTNIWDPKDLISYLAKPTFADVKDRVSDKTHESGQPLLAAHSAYWASPKAWKYIWDVIPV